MVGRLILIILPLMLAACQTVAPAPINDPRAVWCDHNQPIRLPAVAVALLSRAEKEALLAYLMQGEKWCSWAP